MLVATSRTPTQAEQEAALAAVQRVADGSVYVERGYQDTYRIGLVVLVIAAVVVAIAAAATATGLALADAAPDVATFAAVGASPAVRRRLAAGTALVLAGLGTALGIGAGVLPGLAAVWAQRPSGASGYGAFTGSGWPLVIPWSSLLVTAAAAPIITALAAGLLTRSRIVLVRRTD